MIQSLISLEKDETRKAFLDGISQYRKLNKVKTTYMDSYLDAAEEVRARPSDTTYHHAMFCKSDTTLSVPTQSTVCSQWSVVPPAESMN